MMTKSSMYVGSVMHRRLRPRRHHFRYRAYWLLLDLDEIEALSKRMTYFSYNRPNLISFYDSDHGDGTNTPLRIQIGRQLAEAGIDISGGRVMLLCMPRTLGYCFNPLSVFSCHRQDGSLRPSSAEAYMAGEVSSPDLVALLTLASRNAGLADRFKTIRIPRLGLRLRHALNRNTRLGSRRNIAAHYDLGNAFYQRWLDAGMTYSAARFSSAQPDLESAQTAKLDRVLDLLDAREGDRILEIGCGWGSLAERALERHHLTITGITLSTEQLEYARRRLAGSIAAGRCELRLQDYRDVAGTYDRVISIEMLEAVGAAYWSTYFVKLRDCLRPGGTAVLQVITIDEGRF
jgi:2-polyprenyl-3-methyl-5-hydroxy-6-metoxy-1,4-benzoquinol methylase